jgi:D-beta-D-heptose 7-phosphate kinase/D-beta-D-heptose 1-phosphate adenosyltransferase
LQTSISTKNDTIALSGGFDPIHIGHVRMIQGAADFGDVVVILNTDEWLMQKKGYVFMPWEERAEIIKSIKGVTDVVKCIDLDNTVCETLRKIKPTYFGNGGDRKEGNVPEEAVCKREGIVMLWGIGGGKIQSSSWLVDGANEAKSKLQ